MLFRSKFEIEAGTLRLHSAENKGVANRFWHPRCLDATLPPAAAMTGFAALTVDQQEDLRAGLTGVTLPLTQSDPDDPDTRMDTEDPATGAQQTPRLCESDGMGDGARPCESPGNVDAARSGEQAGGRTPAQSTGPEPMDAGESQRAADLPLDDSSDDEGATPREDALHDLFPRLEWWDDCPWEDILHCPEIGRAHV